VTPCAPRSVTRTTATITAHVRLPAGQHTTLTLPIPPTAAQLRKTPAAAVTAVDELLGHHTHAEIADILNQRGLTTGEGRPFHRLIIRNIRDQYGLRGEDRADRPGHRRDLPLGALPPGDHRPGGGHPGDHLRRPFHPRRRGRGTAQRARTGTGFPGRQVRHQRFREALEIIRLLWQGGYRSYQGKHLQLEDARVFDLPGELPPIAVAASGPQSAKIAADLGDGLFATEPDGGLVSTWQRLGGHGPAYGEMPLGWAADEDTAVQAVLDTGAFALTGWKVMADLPDPVNFQAAVASIGPQQVREQFACGPDVKRHLQVARQYADAGFDHLVAMNAGPDPDSFMDFFARKLAGPLRALTPASAAPGNGSAA
jgi:hypothetical protein